MTFCCKGICDGIKADSIPNISRYQSGQKRCSLCAIFLDTSDLGCPCCGARLRTKSRNRRMYGE